jgi:hypothetical protein
VGSGQKEEAEDVLSKLIDVFEIEKLRGRRTLAAHCTLPTAH